LGPRGQSGRITDAPACETRNHQRDYRDTTEAQEPARHDRHGRRERARDDPTLEIPETGSAGDDEDVEGGQPTAQRVRNDELLQGRTEDRRDDVGTPGDGEAYECQPQVVAAQAEGGDRRAP